jgi:hypothetical protein
VVAFANSSYSKVPSLKSAVPDASVLATILESVHEYESFVVPDPDPNSLLTRWDSGWATARCPAAR